MYKYKVFSGNNPTVIKNALEMRGNWAEATDKEATNFNVNFIWRPCSFQLRAYHKLDTAFQPDKKLVINHLENNRVITTKTGLIRTLRSYYNYNEDARSAGYHVFDSIATSFIITAYNEDQEYYLFLQRFKELQKGNSSKERLPLKQCE